MCSWQGVGQWQEGKLLGVTGMRESEDQSLTCLCVAGLSLSQSQGWRCYFSRSSSYSILEG